MTKINLILSSVLTALIITDVNAVQWIKTYDGSTTSNWAGTITLDDWGFVGPQGRQADSFAPYGGQFGNGMYDSMGPAFCIANPASCDIGQMQHVVTSGPDGITPDPPHNILDDFLPNTGNFERANVDSLANFFFWGWTSPAGSTFSNMLIDFDGDYKIAKDDMAFVWYSTIEYTQVIPDGEARIGTTPDGNYYNSLSFQPYAISDASGWCGSVVATHPNAHEAMAGQVKFDLGIDVYRRNADGTLQYFSTEVSPDFEMRSFGDIVVDLSQTGNPNTQTMIARAVVNNTDANVDNQSVGPTTPVGDLSWHNKVSFMGADVLRNTGWCGIESVEWLAGAKGPGVKRLSAIRKDLTNQTACEAAGAKWSANGFSGSAYILRADANRYIDYFDESVYGPDPMTIDTDNDGIYDVSDNCTMVSNASQQDTDSDGYGNACDADFNNDGSVNSMDIGLFKNMFFATGDSEADMNDDQIVNSLDIGLFKARFFQPVGPSATAQ